MVKINKVVCTRCWGTGILRVTTSVLVGDTIKEIYYSVNCPDCCGMGTVDEFKVEEENELDIDCYA